jgi:hypothetical protein
MLPSYMTRIIVTEILPMLVLLFYKPITHIFFNAKGRKKQNA